MLGGAEPCRGMVNAPIPAPPVSRLPAGRSVALGRAGKYSPEASYNTPSPKAGVRDGFSISLSVVKPWLLLVFFAGTPISQGQSPVTQVFGTKLLTRRPVSSICT